MRLSGRKLSPILLLGFFLLAWWMLPSACQRWTEGAFEQFQAPSAVLSSQAHDIATYWQLKTRSKTELIAAGRDLARTNAHYRLSQSRIDALQEEILRLEALLAIPPDPGFTFEVARVASRQTSAWWEQITLRKGSSDGIEPGQGVVSAQGVVGRVRSVTAHTAVVELVSSPGFRMAARLRGVSNPVTYQGAPNIPMQPPRGVALNIPPAVNIDAAEALLLTTSSLGGTFPQGLPIGHVKRLEPGSDGYFQQGVVLMPASLSALQEVAILKPLNATP